MVIRAIGWKGIFKLLLNLQNRMGLNVACISFKFPTNCSIKMDGRDACVIGLPKYLEIVLSNFAENPSSIIYVSTRIPPLSLYYSLLEKVVNGRQLPRWQLPFPKLVLNSRVDIEQLFQSIEINNAFLIKLKQFQTFFIAQ
jgi:hypothetical protein